MLEYSLELENLLFSLTWARDALQVMADSECTDGEIVGNGVRAIVALLDHNTKDLDQVVSNMRKKESEPDADRIQKAKIEYN